MEESWIIQVDDETTPLLCISLGFAPEKVSRKRVKSHACDPHSAADDESYQRILRARALALL